MNEEELKIISELVSITSKNIPKSKCIKVQRIMESNEHYFNSNKKSLCMCGNTQRKMYKDWVSIKMSELYNV